MKSIYFFICIAIVAWSCNRPQKSSNIDDKGTVNVEKKAFQRFFNDSSFWNQPLPENPEIDPRNDGWIKLLETEPSKLNFKLNAIKWTIPVYEVDSTTPVYQVGFRYLSQKDKIHWHTTKDHFGHGKGFDKVPIPQTASPDPEADSHMAVIDYTQKLVWDMWDLKKDSAGNWSSATGMVYDLDGSGVFSTEEIGVVDGESVHFHGPSRAAGVPAIAGLIMYDEVMEGEIRHKIAAASRFCAYKEFVFPAAWTDGFTEGGIPEGATIQLDPNLDLTKFNLTSEETIVCKALQKYGMVLVDIAQGQAIYAEGLWGHPEKSWEGKLPEVAGISKIPYSSYRVLKVNNPIYKGDSRSKFDNVWGD